eukprot:4330446-Prymnesium_polylepis.1
MAVDSTPPPFGITSSDMDHFQTTANIVFTLLFVMELVLKIGFLGLSTYTSNRGNIFDAIVVVA